MTIITAKDAADISNYNNPYIKTINKLVIEAAEKGEYYITIPDYLTRSVTSTMLVVTPTALEAVLINKGYRFKTELFYNKPCLRMYW